LHAQYKGLENNGQFRYTPPTHSMLAFQEALTELQDEGILERVKRYQSNQKILVERMSRMGFETYLPTELQSPVLTTFLYPKSPRFEFEKFYKELENRGMVIYPGKVTKADCFRIGTIGNLFPEDIKNLISAIREVKELLGF
jgi:2-aminoethylphosphonate-pyruvate transaminase